MIWSNPLSVNKVVNFSNLLSWELELLEFIHAFLFASNLQVCEKHSEICSIII